MFLNDILLHREIFFPWFRHFQRFFGITKISIFVSLREKNSYILVTHVTICNIRHFLPFFHGQKTGSKNEKTRPKNGAEKRKKPAEKRGQKAKKTGRKTGPKNEKTRPKNRAKKRKTRPGNRRDLPIPFMAISREMPPLPFRGRRLFSLECHARPHQIEPTKTRK